MELAGLREVDPIGDIRKSISLIKLTQQNWEKMTPEQQGNALLSVMDDVDEAESYIGADWSDLPSQATANMMTFVKSGGTSGMNEMKVTKQRLQEHKSNIKVTWKTMEDMEGDLQDWLSELLPEQIQEVLDTLQNFIDNYEGEMDNDF